ncbi:hypothetical protein GCM10009682_52660 [Luedemannella flava]|uniref:RNA-binding S4 domain-containing protein n=1 Tax=Luedemannella flava TaxID=349316 RepID=A0ABP4YUA4_9ACTN
MSERQLRRTFADALRGEGKTGENLVVLLERGLDATVLRAGLARTIYQARQLVTHGHLRVDGAKVDRPSYRLRPDQVITVKDTAGRRPRSSSPRRARTRRPPARLI